jgi:DNA-binding XRE family transcriptional regulator
MASNCFVSGTSTKPTSPGKAHRPDGTRALLDHPLPVGHLGRILAWLKCLKQVHEVHVLVEIEDLAERAGLHRNYVGQIERGLKAPSLVVFAALAKALGTKPHLLVQAAERRR